MGTHYESTGKRKKKEEPTFGDRLKDAVNKLKSDYHKHSGIPREEDMPGHGYDPDKSERKSKYNLGR